MESNYPFVVFEGCDGVGKTTIRNMVAELLINNLLPVHVVGQHSWLDIESSCVITDIREKRRAHSPSRIVKSYYNDKILHARHNISPQKANAIVIADRYIVSDAVYSKCIYGLDNFDAFDMHLINRTLLPDILFYIDAEVDQAYQRILSRSKATKHYEEPVSMGSIMKAYSDFFNQYNSIFDKRLVRLTNDHGEASNVAHLIYEHILGSYA